MTAYAENGMPEDMPIDLRKKFWHIILASGSASEAMLKLESAGVFLEKYGQFTLREIVDLIFSWQTGK